MTGSLRHYREDGHRLFSELHSEGMRGNRHKLYQGKLTGWKENNFTVKVISNRRGCLVSIEIFKIRQGSEQPDVTLYLALLSAGARTRRPPEVPFNLISFVIL